MNLLTSLAILSLVCRAVAFQHGFPAMNRLSHKSVPNHRLQRDMTMDRHLRSSTTSTGFFMSTSSDEEEAKEIELAIKNGVSNGAIISGSDSAGKNKRDPSEQDKMQMGRQGGDDAVNNLSEVVGQSVMDQSIAMAVNQLINDVEQREKPGFKDNGDVVLSPVEKFRMMYEEIKKKDQGSSLTTVDTSTSKDSTRKDKPVGTEAHEVKEEAYQAKAANMLEGLFGGEQSKDPFDERKVMMKLKQMLDIEDFKGLFLDPKIGDYL